MPTIFRIGRYVVYFWTNEGEPREPIHVHVALGHAEPNATKIWITREGKAVLANNNSRIPVKGLGRIIKAIEEESNTIINEWLDYFGEVNFFC